MLPDFLVLRKAARLELRINKLAINADFEAPAVRRNKNEPFDSGFQVGNKLFGQTDRLGLVLSNLAVDYFDFHLLCLLDAKPQIF